MNRAASSTRSTGSLRGRRPSTATGIPMQRHRRRFKLRHLLFFLLVFSGIAPLLISSYLLIHDNKDVLETQKKELLTYSAQKYADEISSRLSRLEDEMRQLGRGLLAHPGYAEGREQDTWDWANDYMLSYVLYRTNFIAMEAVDAKFEHGWGWIPLDNRKPNIERILTETSEAALAKDEKVYRFFFLSQNDTAVVLAFPLLGPNNETIVMRGIVKLSMAELTKASGSGTVDREDLRELFLIDADGGLLWSSGSNHEVEAALLKSDMVDDFIDLPTVSVVRTFDLGLGSGVRETLARIVQVTATGWGVVAHKPKEEAFESVQKMVKKTFFISIALVFLAFALALAAARGLSQPIQQLVQASHEIAAGNFDRRVKTQGLGLEIADLAEDFNRMSDTVESYIEQLKKAVKQNRDLFISTIRAFAATIDAKDPYTRGHSERVASYSRSIARYLGLPKDMQEKVWISAVLHDVGKIGIDDQVLKKVGVLTPEEFEQMKLHPVIGAEIVEPISALREMIPGIRWHHEAVNGTGYPDNLKGEEIPLMARIIGVADTFDAITTTRPYQNAYSTDYALQTIKKLTGKRFDPKIVTAFLLAFEAGQIEFKPTEPETAPQPTTPQPTTPQPTTPQPTTPQPTTPQPTTPQPMAPRQAAPQQAAPQPTSPKPVEITPQIPSTRV